jgi:nitrogenase-stabilizing/protective protein
MSENELELDMDELVSAEDFLDYFGIEYEASIVHVNRLHILQRFHDYIAQAGALPEDETELRAFYRGYLLKAYDDFVNSDALTEKVFKVFHMNEPQTGFVPLEDLKL